MTDLDTLMRAGLDELTADIGGISSERLTERLMMVRARRARRRHRRGLAVVSVLVVLAGVVAAATHSRGPGNAIVSTGPTTSDGPGFELWGSGWHVLDAVPVPAMNRASLGWTGHELIVAGDGVAYGYQPGPGTWRELPPPPFGRSDVLGFTWTGKVLVAVDGTTASGRSATWSPETDRWRDLGVVPIARSLKATGASGPHAASGGAALVWTGQRVLDLTHGAVLDPGADEWTTLAMPSALVPFAQLALSVPVWAGGEVVLSSWSIGPGLAWDPTGSTYRQLPGLPAGLVGPSPDVNSDTAATVLGDGVVLVNGDGLAARFDLRTGLWSALPTVPGMGTGEGCPSSIVTVAGYVVVAPCDGTPPVVLRAGAWQSTGPPPTSDPCCTTSWIDAGRALVSWSTSTDTINGPPKPYRHGEVWIP